MSYILTVLIPTKNRLHYLKGALECIQSLNSNEIEVIVQDNSDNGQDVRAYVASCDNRNIKYYYDERKLSQTENSELAASHATGKYVCYIGDDDSICESILTLAHCMDKYEIDSAIFGVANYNWPDLVEEKKELIPFVYREINEIVIKECDSRKNLLLALKDGMINIKELPRVYHGIISKRLLDECKNKSGSFFPGPSPDMANATVCALYAKNQIYINMPMIIDGYGKSSAGGMGQRNLHKGSLKNNFQLRSDVEEQWDSRIPKLWMPDTIWPNSAIKALEACDKKEYINEMNFEKIYFNTLLHDKNSLDAIKECGLSFFDYIGVFISFMKKCIKKIKSMMEKSNYIEHSVVELINMKDAFGLQNVENSKHNIEAAFELFYRNKY